MVSGDSGLVRPCRGRPEPVDDTPADARAQRSMTGAQVDQLDDEALAQRVNDVLEFSEMSPLQKARVVGALQARGHVVGHMGDGINDAPALRKADVGISVTDGVDIAKDTADIILLEQDLRVLRDGILEGRRTFGNIQKYLKITVASNFGNVFGPHRVGVHSVPAMLAVQLLVQNMLYDISQTSLPWDRVDESVWPDRQMDRWAHHSLHGDSGSGLDHLRRVAFPLMCSSSMRRNHCVRCRGPHVAASVPDRLVPGGICTQVMVVHMIRTEKILSFSRLRRARCCGPVPQPSPSRWCYRWCVHGGRLQLRRPAGHVLSMAARHRARLLSAHPAGEDRYIRRWHEWL